MWLGLLYFPPGEAPDTSGEWTRVCAWVADHDRPLTFDGPPEAVPDIARLIRRASSSSAWIAEPRCDACGNPVELPPV